MFFRLLLLLFAVMLAYHFSHVGSQGAAQATVATAAEKGTEGAVMTKNGYRIVPLEAFQIEARVLSAKRYRFDRESHLAPVDLALGWGSMANPAVIQKVSVNQSDRWYYWRASEFPIPRRDIETHSANMHMIPATPAIEKKLEAAQEGDTIHLKGYLVGAQSPDGWHWRSSLSREDTGAGACELVWVESLDVR